MNTRQQIHQLVDELDEDILDTAHQWLTSLRHVAPDDDGPLKPEMLEELDRALTEETVPHEEVRRMMKKL